VKRSIHVIVNISQTRNAKRDASYKSKQGPYPKPTKQQNGRCHARQLLRAILANRWALEPLCRIMQYKNKEKILTPFLCDGFNSRRNEVFRYHRPATGSTSI
jgi:hypothetical protein